MRTPEGKLVRKVRWGPVDRDRLEGGELTRASGDVRCSCGDLYYDHPHFCEPYEFVTVLCDGRLVKL